MPFSSHNGKDFAQQVVEALYHDNGDRLAILDLGAGSGTYLRLLQQSRLERAHCDWCAVEIWEPYVEQFHLREFYDTVLIADIRDQDGALSSLPKRHFDLAIVGDVLEHIEIPEATQLFLWLAGFCERILLSIPIKHYPQDELNGNPYEKHVVDDWSHAKVLDWLDGEVRSGGRPAWTCVDHRCYRDVGVYVLRRASEAAHAVERPSANGTVGSLSSSSSA